MEMFERETSPRFPWKECISARSSRMKSKVRSWHVPGSNEMREMSHVWSQTVGSLHYQEAQITLPTNVLRLCLRLTAWQKKNFCRIRSRPDSRLDSARIASHPSAQSKQQTKDTTKLYLANGRPDNFSSTATGWLSHWLALYQQMRALVGGVERLQTFLFVHYQFTAPLSPALALFLARTTRVELGHQLN